MVQQTTAARMVAEEKEEAVEEEEVEEEEVVEEEEELEEEEEVDGVVEEAGMEAPPLVEEIEHPPLLSPAQRSACLIQKMVWRSSRNSDFV